ncbi:hypothetical protein [Rugamonas sp.]|uniref:hypothetical protein n=1 Tax=Rugamonas sp. TaxID=1926287 RepID=UPI0025EB5315|nr:hypothetical protein [Rugamonas sp.]
MNSVHHPSQNHLLAEPQEAGFGRLAPFPELVRMARGDVLHQTGMKTQAIPRPPSSLPDLLACHPLSQGALT